MIAIPAIDLIDNKVVRLFQGDYKKITTYTKDPVAYALELQQNGLSHLHLVDLSGAKAGKLVHTAMMQEIVNATGLRVDFGGGIQSKEDVECLIKAGAAQVVIGSLCVKEPESVKAWINEFGVERFVLALDTDGQQLKIKGWQEESGVTLQELMAGFKDFEHLCILSTDIRKDGTGKGPSVELYRELVQQFPKQRWIASGGVESLADLYTLREIGCYGCVIGKALLDGKISLQELKAFNDERL